MFVASDVLAVPLSPLGCGDLATMMGDYISMDLDIHISVNEVENQKQHGKETSPVVVLVWHPIEDASSDVLERSADRSFARAKRSLSLITGDRIDVMGTILLHQQGHEYRMSPLKSKRRSRLWMSSDEAAGFEKQVVGLAAKSEIDTRLSLALQMYLDATNERSVEFRLVKLYNVLECLSYEFKSKDIGSRDAIRKKLNVVPGQNWSVEYRGNRIQFDLISVAGKFRDAIMHGSRTAEDTFAVADRGVIEVLSFEPFKIADELHRFVDETFWRMANDEKE